MWGFKKKEKMNLTYRKLLILGKRVKFKFQFKRATLEFLALWLATNVFGEVFQFSSTLQVLDLSRNRIRELPPEIGTLTQLR